MPARPVSSHSFFFQAEDGIRYLYVTGVQTCALPILLYLSLVVLSACLSCSILDPIPDVLVAFVLNPIVNGVNLRKALSDFLCPKPEHLRFVNDGGNVSKRITSPFGSLAMLVFEFVDANSQKPISSPVAFLDFVSHVFPLGRQAADENDRDARAVKLTVNPFLDCRFTAPSDRFP